MKALPTEAIEKDRWIIDSHGTGHRVMELDADLIDWDRARFMDVGHDVDGNEFHLIRYRTSDRTNRLAAVYCEPEISTEDLMEWMASSSGTDYYVYIGQY